MSHTSPPSRRIAGRTRSSAASIRDSSVLAGGASVAVAMLRSIVLRRGSNGEIIGRTPS
jgi:hypothetical protein